MLLEVRIFPCCVPVGRVDIKSLRSVDGICPGPQKIIPLPHGRGRGNIGSAQTSSL